MSTTRLKMQVNSVKINRSQSGSNDSEEIELSAVYGDANQSWSKWTPFASLRFTVTNPAVFEKIKPGQYYFVDLTETTKEG